MYINLNTDLKAHAEYDPQNPNCTLLRLCFNPLWNANIVFFRISIAGRGLDLSMAPKEFEISINDTKKEKHQ